MTQDPEYEPIHLPEDIMDRVDQRVKYTEFESVQDYVVYVLEEVLYEVEQQNKMVDMTEIDEDQVQERLKSLGYLNE